MILKKRKSPVLTLGLAPVLSELQEAGHQQRPQIFPVLSKSLILLYSLEKQHERQEAWHVRKVPEMKQTAPLPVTGGRERRRRARVSFSWSGESFWITSPLRPQSLTGSFDFSAVKAGRRDVCGMWSNKYQQQQERMSGSSERKDVCYKPEIKRHEIPAAVWRTLMSSCLTKAEDIKRYRLHVAVALCDALWIPQPN